MGASVSTITASLTAEMQENQSSACTTEDVCQSTHVGSVTIDGDLDCPDINIGTNNNKSSFQCSVNQSATAMSNIAQSMQSTASAFYGEVSDSSINQSIGVSMSINQTSSCGGAASSTHSVADSGACRSGIVQQSEVDSFTVGESGTVACDTLNIGVNTSNSHTTCTMGQASKMDNTITQQGTSLSQGQDPLVAFMVILLIVAMLLLMAPMLVVGVMHVVGRLKKGLAAKERHADRLSALDKEKYKLEMVETRGKRLSEQAALTRKLKAAGVSSASIEKAFAIPDSSDAA